MKLLIVFLVCAISLAASAQREDAFFFNIGGQVSSVSESEFKQWALEHVEGYPGISGYSSPIKISSFTYGPALGFSYFKGRWLMGGTIVWNQASHRNEFTDINGNIERRKFKLKYNHWEMPFFFFPGRSIFGFGGTMDVGYHKLVEYHEKDSGNGFEIQGAQHLKQIQLGYKIGLKIFTNQDSRHQVSGMLYYQSGLFNGTLTGNPSYLVKPRQLGLRLEIAIAPSY